MKKKKSSRRRSIQQSDERQKSETDDNGDSRGVSEDSSCEKRTRHSHTSLADSTSPDLPDLVAVPSTALDYSGSSSSTTVPVISISSTAVSIERETLDIGEYTTKEVQSDELRLKLLESPWIPLDNYNFKEDVEPSKRPFLHKWLNDYPWLAYSASKKGPFCRHCVVFRQNVKRGHQGWFITTPCLRFKDFNDRAKQHELTEWHKDSVSKSINFVEIIRRKKLSVYEQVNITAHNQIEKNRMKLRSIIASAVFCGTHDLPLRGKTDVGSVFSDLLNFRVESGDNVLKEHFATCAENAKFTSHETQNEIIDCCQIVLKRDLVNDINGRDCKFFSVLADETSDISGKEQLSIGIRFVSKSVDDESKYMIKEEFIGFTPLDGFDAKSISSVILASLENAGLDMDNMVGQGYDGCSTMAGCVSGVQSLIRQKYSKALYYHCASHKFNLALNDQSTLPSIRNTVGTVKEIIQFFRDSPLRRQILKINLPLLSETRWSSKYQSIRVF